MNEDWRNELITKGAAFDAQEAYMADHPLDGYEDGLAMIDMLRNLPPARPKKVKWIKKMKTTETDTYTSYDPEWYCPKCGTKYHPFFAQNMKFCCVCGVGIMEEQDCDVVLRRQIK